MFVAGYVRHTDPIEVIDGSTESNCIGDVACSCFKTRRRRLIDRLLKGDIDDHISSALPWGSIGQCIRLAVKNPDASWREDLVARKDIKITVEGLHVDGH